MNVFWHKEAGRTPSLTARGRTGNAWRLLGVFALLGWPSGGCADPDATNRPAIHPPRMHVIDVRTEAEWRAGHIPNAILIPYDQIQARITEVTTNKTASIALYCRSGRRSGIARKTLQDLGYLHVENLGGLDAARKKLEGSPQ